MNADQKAMHASGQCPNPASGDVPGQDYCGNALTQFADGRQSDLCSDCTNTEAGSDTGGHGTPRPAKTSSDFRPEGYDWQGLHRELKFEFGSPVAGVAAAITTVVLIAAFSHHANVFFAFGVVVGILGVVGLSQAGSWVMDKFGALPLRPLIRAGWTRRDLAAVAEAHGAAAEAEAADANTGTSGRASRLRAVGE